MCPYDDEPGLWLLLDLTFVLSPFSRPLSSEVVLIKCGVILELSPCSFLCYCLFFVLVWSCASLCSLLNHHINPSFFTLRYILFCFLNLLIKLFVCFFHICPLSLFPSLFHIGSSSLRPVRMVTRSIWNTCSSMGQILPPRMLLETLPCTSVLYITR